MMITGMLCRRLEIDKIDALDSASTADKLKLPYGDRHVPRTVPFQTSLQP